MVHCRLSATAILAPRMDDSNITLRRVTRTAGYLLGGGVVTAVVALVVLYVGRPIQPAVYDAFYRHLGPSEATTVAILTHFLFAGTTAASVVLVGTDYVGDRLAHRGPVAKAIAVLVGCSVAFVSVVLLELGSFLLAVLGLAAALVAIPAVLWYRSGVGRASVFAFVGGIPVLVFLALMAGFGLGWGWGYTLTAQEVPASAADGTSAVDFQEAPQIRDDLFASDCSTGRDGRQVCQLSLRGYQREIRATRFLARHGVRCPYLEGSLRQSGSFVARSDTSYYRITCSPHGD